MTEAKRYCRSRSLTSAYQLLLSPISVVGLGQLNCLGGAQLLSASVSWAPTVGGHQARQLLPSPSHLDSTHETHEARRRLAAGRGWCEKRTSHAPFAHARASPREVGSVTLFHFLPLEMQYWTDSNSIPFNISLCSICTDKLVPHAVLGETERKEKRPHCVVYWGCTGLWDAQNRKGPLNSAWDIRPIISE